MFPGFRGVDSLDFMPRRTVGLHVLGEPARLEVGVSTTGRKIYGHDLEEGRVYELQEPIRGG
jgi:hypothetical protein